MLRVGIQMQMRQGKLNETKTKEKKSNEYDFIMTCFIYVSF